MQAFEVNIDGLPFVAFYKQNHSLVLIQKHSQKYAVSTPCCTRLDSLLILALQFLYIVSSSAVGTLCGLGSVLQVLPKAGE